jgi:S1-C subfamily serine protease
MRTHWRRLLCALLGTLVLGGCASSTRFERNEAAAQKEYGDVYFLAMDKDPREVMPKAIKEFESMGFNVKVVPAGKSIEGAQGTGFVVTADGHVLTCAHVLGDQSAATVWVSGSRYEADVVSSDKDRDLALLKPRTPVTPSVPPVSFRNDKRYTIGEDVFTIGYPLGSMLGNSIRYTKGSVSSTTGIKDDPKQLQVSAQIQPGNSGGPLFDKDGIAIGVIQATLNPQRMAEETGGQLPQNVNFAIKNDVVLEYMKAYQAVGQSLVFNKAHSIEDLQKSVVRVRAGIVSEEWEKKPKLVARVDYVSMWDMWYRFRLFVVRVFDFDSGELLLAAGQDRDNIISNEDVVIRDTFAQVRKALKKS